MQLQTRARGPILVEGEHYWILRSKHWERDATQWSPSSAELLLSILEERPDLWSQWQAGKNKQGQPARKSQVNEAIVAELRKRKAPTARSAPAVQSYVSGNEVSSSDGSNSRSDEEDVRELQGRAQAGHPPHRRRR